MLFPNETLQLLQEEINQLRNGTLKNQSHIEVFVVRAEQPDKPIDGLLDSWELVSLDGHDMELKLNFNEPLQVSSGSEPDLLMV